MVPIVVPGWSAVADLLLTVRWRVHVLGVAAEQLLMAMAEVVVVAAQLEKFARPRRHLEQGRANRACMTAAVTRRVRMVEAIDVSRGVLAVLKWLKGASNIVYETPEEA
jgi:hypothetical protein